MTSIRDASRRLAASRSLRFARRLAPAPTRDRALPGHKLDQGLHTCASSARGRRKRSVGLLLGPADLHHALARAVRALVGEPRRGCQGVTGAPGTGTWRRICRRSDRCAPAGTPALAEHVTVLPRFHRIPCRGDAWGARGVCVATGNPMATFARKRARARFAPKGRARAACAPVPALGATMPLRSTNGCAMVSGEQDLTQ